MLLLALSFYFSQYLGLCVFFTLLPVIKLIKDRWHGSRHISVIINETKDYTRSRAGKSTGYRPTLKPLIIIESCKPSIIFGTETWLSNDTSPYEYIPSSKYSIYTKNRKDGYGGVLLAISNQLTSTQITKYIPAHAVTSIEQSSILKGHLFLVP